MPWFNWPSFFLGAGVAWAIAIVGTFALGMWISHQDLREEDAEREQFRRLQDGGE